MKPVAIPAHDHSPNREADAARETDAVDQQAGERRTGGVGDGESSENPAVLLAREMEIGAQQRRESGQRLAVQIIDGGGEHEDGKNPPAVAPRRGWVRRHWNSMVATSPAVARRASALGKYSMVTRRGFLNAASQLRLVASRDDDLAGVADQQLHGLVVVAFHHQARLFAQAIHLLEAADEFARGLRAVPPRNGIGDGFANRR